MRSGFVLALVSACSLGACAKADKISVQLGGGDHPDGGGITRPDSGSGSSAPRIDAFIPPDAPPGVMEKTLTQTTTDDITPNNAVACAPKASSGHIGTLDNSYYRVFDLADYGITGDFTVETLTFQVEDDISGVSDNGDTTVDVAVGTYAGAVGATLPGTLSSVATATDIDVPIVDEEDGDPGATINVPLAATIPAGSKLYAQVHSAGGQDEMEFYMGTTDSGESGTSYLSSTECKPTPGPTPTSVATLAGSSVHSALLLTVTGTY